MGKTFKDRRKFERKREERDNAGKEDPKQHRKRFREVIPDEDEDERYSEYDEY